MVKNKPPPTRAKAGTTAYLKRTEELDLDTEDEEEQVPMKAPAPTGQEVTMTTAPAPTTAHVPTFTPPPAPPVAPTENLTNPLGPTPFARYPALAVAACLDYRTSEAIKLYSKATARLQEDTLFDANADQLFRFIKSLKDRAVEFGWTLPNRGILMIKSDPADPLGQEFDFLDSYGAVTLELLEQNELTYINKETRKTQDTSMLYKCLMTSLSTSGQSKVLCHNKQYLIGPHFSGLLLLKIIIRESCVDTQATAATIRTRLSTLDTYMGEIGSDITKFNGYVMMLVEMLNTRGHTTSDLLINLFKGYATASDATFRGYISRQRERYDDDEQIPFSLLMLRADNKYKSLKEQGLWNAPTADESKILALETQTKQLKKELQGKKGNSRHNRRGSSNQRSSNPRSTNRPPFYWQKPKSGEEHKKKEWKNKTYNYCCTATGGKCPGRWVTHNPKRCDPEKFKRGRSTTPTTPTTPPTDTAKPSKKLRLAKVLKAKKALLAEQVAIMGEPDSDESDE